MIRRSQIASGIAHPEIIILRPSEAVASHDPPKMSFSIFIFSIISCFFIERSKEIELIDTPMGFPGFVKGIIE